MCVRVSKFNEQIVVFSQNGFNWWCFPRCAAYIFLAVIIVITLPRNLSFFIAGRRWMVRGTILILTFVMVAAVHALWDERWSLLKCSVNFCHS